MMNVLNERERECLYWAANDKNLQGTAHALHLSVSTIKTHRWRLRKKLRCTTMTGALFVALKAGLLKNT